MLDVAVIGGGVIGLSTAYELGLAGAAVHVLGAARHGTASEASAGLLAPSMGVIPAAMRSFFETSLDAYPHLVGRLQEFDSGLRIIDGLIEVGSGHAGAAANDRGGRHLTRAEVASLDPNVAAPRGALFHARDGATDNERLVRALRAAVDAAPSVSHDVDDVVGVEFSASHTTVLTASGKRVVAGCVVLAAGAWAPQVGGLPRPLPVTPLKGQMLALASTVLRHPTVGDDVYLVPREKETIVGATTEHAGFDTSVDPTAIERLRRAAIALCPSLASAAVLRRWAGIRPASPDLFPILGPDPLAPLLIYACGHSKNGILLAAGTANAIAAVALGGAPAVDIGPFSVDRFRR